MKNRDFKILSEWITSEITSRNWIDALSVTDSAEDRHGLIERFAAVDEEDLAQRLHAEVLRWLYVDVAKAERIGEAASYLGGRTADGNSRGLLLRVSGHVHFATSQYRQALERYEEALGLFDCGGNEAEAGRTLISGTQTLIYLGRYTDALDWAARAREIFERTGDKLRLARLDSNIGNIHYRQDRYSDAMLAYLGARGPLEELGEPRDVAAVLSNIAVCSISLGDFSKALATYHETREYCERHNLGLLVGDADYNIAYLHYLRGDYTLAVGLYEAARARCRDARDDYHLALCDLDESEIYLELNLNRESARLAAAAATGFQRLGMAYENAKAIVNQAAALSQRDDFDHALRLFRRARRRFVRERNHVWPALVDLYRALVHERRGAFEDSRLACQKAYRFLAKSPLPGKAALCELLEARLELAIGNPGAARQCLVHAKRRIDEAGVQSLRFHAAFIRGEMEEALGNADSAIQAYEDARREIEAVQSGLWSEELKIAFLGDKLAVWENLVWHYLNRGNAKEEWERVFLLIEEAKSRILAKLMQSSGSAFEWGEDGEPGALVRQARQLLNANYRQIEAALAEESTAAAVRVEALRKLASLQEAELVRAMDQLAPKSGPENLPDSIDPIRRWIPQDTLFVQYYCARGTIHACLLSREDLTVIPLGAVKDVREALCLLQFQVSKFGLGAADAAAPTSAVIAHLRSLFRELIAPIRKRLGAKHLVIAPHGLLHRVPFHALHDGERFLIDDFGISYAPSATVYAHCRARPSNRAGDSLVLGVPDERTPFIETEALSVAALLPRARVFLREDATEEKLRQYGEASRFIHIATHGLFRAENPMFSSIRLGDSWLNLLDLYRLSLSAELVTLSGCSTGVNVIAGGDEILGLTRGLLYAGAAGILVTLWEVNDRSTADFMSRFYAEVARHGDKGAALRDAMRGHRERYPHPFHWAPFVLVGDHAPR